jgi:hypothetical protein
MNQYVYDATQQKWGLLPLEWVNFRNFGRDGGV